MKRALFFMPRAVLASQTDSCGMESALHVMRPALHEVVSMRLLPVLLSALALAACGSSGGTSTPPAPPPPVTPTPPPPPPEPTFEERLANLAEFDPNPCRAETPGFEALGGWLKNDGREIGGSRVWIDDVGELSEEDSHGARVWATLIACAVRSNEDHYNEKGALHWESIRADGGDGIVSLSLTPVWEDIELPEPGVWAEYPYVRPGILDRAHDGTREGQRLLRLAAAGNDGGKRTSWLQDAGFQLASAGIHHGPAYHRWWLHWRRR